MIKAMQTTTSTKKLRREVAEVKNKKTTDFESVSDNLALIEAESDRQLFDLLEMNNELSHEICTTFLATLSILAQGKEKFTKLRNPHGQTRIVYANHGYLFAPTCMDVDEVEIIEEPSECYRNILVKFSIGNVTTIGHLESSGIIRSDGALIPCSEQDTSIYLPEMDKLVESKNGKTQIRSGKITRIQPFNLLEEPDSYV